MKYEFLSDERCFVVFVEKMNILKNSYLVKVAVEDPEILYTV